MSIFEIGGFLIGLSALFGYLNHRWRAGKITRGKYSNAWDDLQHGIFGNMDLLRRWHGADACRYGHHAVFCEASLRRLMLAAGLSGITTDKPNHPDNVTLCGVKHA